MLDFMWNVLSQILYLIRSFGGNHGPDQLTVLEVIGSRPSFLSFPVKRLEDHESSTEALLSAQQIEQAANRAERSHRAKTTRIV